MTIGGWIILTVSVGTVTALFIWCIFKVIRTSGETKHMHGFEFETPDENDDAQD